MLLLGSSILYMHSRPETSGMPEELSINHPQTDHHLAVTQDVCLLNILLKYQGHPLTSMIDLDCNAPSIISLAWY
jgi:hypothetical protein